jgi:hypothetical protein
MGRFCYYCADSTLQPIAGARAAAVAKAVLQRAQPAD